MGVPISEHSLFYPEGRTYSPPIQSAVILLAFGGRRRALTQRARQIRWRSFAVNSDGFVYHKTMYHALLYT